MNLPTLVSSRFRRVLAWRWLSSGVGVVGLGLLGLVFLGCQAAIVPESSNPAPSGSGVGEAPRYLSLSGSTATFTMYLPRLFEDGSLSLRGVARELVWSDAPAHDALEQLIQGPNGDERAANFHYPLDRRTRLRSASIAEGTATLDFESGLERIHGNPFSELTYWSILFTVTEVPGVERIALLDGGVRLAALGFPPFSVPTVGRRADAPDWAGPR